MKPLPKTGHKTIKCRQSTQRHLLYISNIFIFPIYLAPGSDRSPSAVSGWEQRAMGYGSLRSFRDIILFIHVAHCQWENIFFNSPIYRLEDCNIMCEFTSKFTAKRSRLHWWCKYRHMISHTNQNSYKL